jgi:hypothetical protein
MLAKHQKELALFALPRLDEDDDAEEPDENEAEDGEVSMESEESSNEVGPSVSVPCGNVLTLLRQG